MLIGKRVNVLDQGWIELVDCLPRPEFESADQAIVNAARVSFLGESKGPEADQKLLKYLWTHRHTTPFEMVELKFIVNAPVVVWWQWVRHRTFSYNSQSGRYTEFDESAFYVPDEWRAQSKSNKQGSDGGVNQTIGQELTQELLVHYDRSYQLYKKALLAGVAKEQARLFLPGWSSYYKMVVKGNLHNWLHMLELRTALEAQYEIRVYADAILREFIAPFVPWVFEEFEHGHH